MKRIRVLHILNELKPSGAELMLHAAAKLWESRGIHGEILCTGERIGSLGETLEKDGFTIHHIPFSPNALYVRRVFKLIGGGQYDVVHIHTERANFWYGIVARMASIPSVVRTVHNVFPFHGWLWLRRYVGRKILRILGVKNISISESVKRTELERYSNPTELIPNWFEDAKYIPPTEAQRASCRRELGIDDDTFVSISVGGCWEYKNHPAILRALKQIENSRELLYFHVGMEDAKRSEFLLAQELGLDGIVRFTGIVPDILPYLHAADVFLMPSLWEGFGCAAIEAMGCGLPTVLSDVPGLSDFKATCPEIRWVDCTPDSIASMLLELRRMNLEERRELGDKLAQSARTFFGTSNGAMRYGDLYRSGVSEKF